MTSENTSSHQNPTDPAPSGADLARVALQAARAAAKHRPKSDRKPKRRPLVRREDGRDPAKLGAAITHLVASRGWEAPAAGGTVMDRWPEIAPELAEAGNVLPVAFDAEERVLTLRPANNAFGTQLRLFGRQLITRINTAMGAPVVNELRVLPPGNRPIPGAPIVPSPSAPPAEDAEGPDMPRRTITREEASPGYRKALDQLHATRDRQPEPNERHKELRERYFAGAYTRGAEVEVDPEAEAAAERARREAEVRQAALRRARRERAERTQAAGKVFDTTA